MISACSALCWKTPCNNAWEFTGKRDPAKVEFGVDTNPANKIKIYYIRDNGVGFNMNSHKRCKSTVSS